MRSSFVVIAHDGENVGTHTHVPEYFHRIWSPVHHVAYDVKFIVIAEIDFFQHGQIFFVFAVKIGHRVDHMIAPETV